MIFLHTEFHLRLIEREYSYENTGRICIVEILILIISGSNRGFDSVSIKNDVPRFEWII
jgi:hypothetical protein